VNEFFSCAVIHHRLAVLLSWSNDLIYIYYAKLVLLHLLIKPDFNMHDNLRQSASSTSANSK
jgi:hypothetical protein